MRPRIVSRREPAALKPAWRQVHVGAKWPVRLLLVGLLLTVHLGPARAQDVPYLVKDINTATDDSSPDGLTDVNGTLFFVASDPTNGRELWKSDGTAAGTVLVKDINPGSDWSFSVELTDVKGTLFFAATDPTHGWGLWKSDGTVEGTVLVKDAYPGSGGREPDQLTAVNGTLFFVADDPTNAFELWKSDGTAEGTVLVKDIYPTAAADSLPVGLRTVNEPLCVGDGELVVGAGLWNSEGTVAGMVLVADSRDGGGDGAREGHQLRGRGRPRPRLRQL